MNQCKGFSLIELMISMLLGIIVVAGTLSVYLSTIRGSTSTVNSVRLNHDIDSVMQVMINDVRRSGYWGGAVVDSDARNNPFVVGTANIQITNKTGEAANSCILYSYDADGSGANTLNDQTDDLDLDEYYGFRLNGDGIDMRFSIAVGDDPSDCDEGSWENIIDNTKVVISALSFSNANYKCLNVNQGVGYELSCDAVIAADATDLVAGEKAVEIRQIDIALQGEVEADATVTKSLTGIVKVRNERIFTQP